MKDKHYWTFDERHPLKPGNHSVSDRIERVFDRIDDAFTAWIAAIDFYRIQRHSFA